MTRRGRPRRETPSFEELGREWVFNFSLPAHAQAHLPAAPMLGGGRGLFVDIKIV